MEKKNFCLSPQLSDQTVVDFTALYFRKTGIKLTDDESNEKTMELLTFMKKIYKPIKEKRSYE